MRGPSSSMLCCPNDVDCGRPGDGGQYIVSRRDRTSLAILFMGVPDGKRGGTRETRRGGDWPGGGGPHPGAANPAANFEEPQPERAYLQVGDVEPHQPASTP